MRIYIQPLATTKNASIRVINGIGESKSFALNNCVRLGIRDYLREIKLEYFGAHISVGGYMKLVIKRFFTVFLENPLHSLRHLIFQTYIELPEDFSKNTPLEIFSDYQDDIWISRYACVSGIKTKYLSAQFEYDFIRRSTLKGFRVWSTSLKLNLSSASLSNNDKFPAFESNLVDFSNTLDTTSLTIKDAKVLGGLALYEGNTYIRISEREPRESRSWPSSFPSRFPDGKLRSHSPIRGLEQEHCLFIGFSTSWYHFILEYFPLLTIAKSIVGPIPLIIPTGVPYQIKELIFRIGFFELIECGPTEEILVKQLCTVIERPGVSLKNNSGQDAILVLQAQISNTFTKLELEISSSERRIYLVRSKSLLRGFSNFEKLNVLLEKYNFEFVNPENITLAEQIILFRSAGTVVAESGAAITSLIFSPPNVTLIELRPFSGDREMFWDKYVESLGHIHYYIESDRNLLDRLKVNAKPQIRINELSKLLQNLFVD